MKRSFENGIIEELTLEKMHALSNRWYKLGLIDEVDPRKNLMSAMREFRPEANEIKSARVVRTHAGNKICIGDIAFATVDGSKCLVEVWWHARADMELVSCVSVWEKQVSVHTRNY